jgi:hypothetical protein
VNNAPSRTFEYLQKPWELAELRQERCAVFFLTFDLDAPLQDIRDAHVLKKPEQSSLPRKEFFPRDPTKTMVWVIPL